jgi:hypothetical protein
MAVSRADKALRIRLWRRLVTSGFRTNGRVNERLCALARSANVAPPVLGSLTEDWLTFITQAEAINILNKLEGRPHG